MSFSDCSLSLDSSWSDKAFLESFFSIFSKCFISCWILRSSRETAGEGKGRWFWLLSRLASSVESGLLGGLEPSSFRFLLRARCSIFVGGAEAGRFREGTVGGELDFVAEGDVGLVVVSFCLVNPCFGVVGFADFVGVFKDPDFVLESNFPDFPFDFTEGDGFPPFITLEGVCFPALGVVLAPWLPDFGVFWREDLEVRVGEGESSFMSSRQL